MDLTPEQFLSEATALLDIVESAVTKLKDCNDGLEVKRHHPSTLSHTSTEMTSHVASTDDDYEDNDTKYSNHGGQLSIEIKSPVDFYWSGGAYLLTIHPYNSDLSG